MPALLALHTGRPVLLALSRADSLRFSVKRHAFWMDYTVACDAEGHLVAVKARMVGDNGAYASVGGKVLERAAGHACSAYGVPNVDVETRAVYTNNPPSGAMRGFGANQANFGMESLLDRLAEQVGIDGWEIRWRNALAEGDRFGTGQKLGPGRRPQGHAAGRARPVPRGALRGHRLRRQEHGRRQRPQGVRAGRAAARTATAA